MRTQSSSLLLLTAAVALLLASPVTAQQKMVLPDDEKELPGQPTEVFAVGKEEGESWEMLSNVQAVVFDRQDNLYVLDSGNFRVLVFDKAGKFVREIGKQGNGPGELTFPLGLALAPDGNLVIADMGRGGFAIFRPDGTYVKNVAAPEGMRPGAPGSGGFYIDASGNALFRTMTIFRGGPGGPAPLPEGPIKSPIVRTALTENARPTTLYEFLLPAPKVQESGRAGGRAMRMVMFAPPTFAPPTAWAALPNGTIAVAHEPEYSIELVDANGKVARVVERDQKPRKVTKRDQDRAREERKKQLNNPSNAGGGIRVTNNNGRTSYGFGGSRPEITKAQIEEQLRSMTFAEFMPLIQSLRADPLGRIWVLRMPDEVGDEALIDLLGPDGRYLGTLDGQKVPDGVSTSGLAAYIERDELDIQRVAVRRLPAAWSAGLSGTRGVGQN